MEKQTQTTLFPQSRIQILENILLIENSILVIADLHIGIEEAILRKGLAPRAQVHEMITNLNKIFNKLNKQKIKLQKIIILGDLKHEHGKISDEEWRETLYFLDIISKKAKEIILIKGNHDNILGPIAYKRDLIIKPYYQYKDILFMHGHKEYKIILREDTSKSSISSELKSQRSKISGKPSGVLDKKYKKALESKSKKTDKIKILILGHLHPAITLKDEYKKEKYKSFLVGRWKKKQVYVLPSFNPISTGYDLTITINPKGKYYHIIPENKYKNFNVIISSQGQAYDFGKLKTLK